MMQLQVLKLFCAIHKAAQYNANSITAIMDSYYIACE